MSIWMLLLFALAMVAGVLGFGADTAWTAAMRLVFAGTVAIFLIGLLLQGVRRPVV